MPKAFENLIELEPLKLIFSAKSRPDNRYRKQVALKCADGKFQLESFSDKQTFHQNLSLADLQARLLVDFGANFRQLEIFTAEYLYSFRLTAKNHLLENRKKISSVSASETKMPHDRTKNYLLCEDMLIPPLVKLGIFTPEGKIIKKSYDKFRQINRFLELINDSLTDVDMDKEFHIIDFGCGKSYLTFVLYYFFHEVKKFNVHIVGLDLKADVIKNCNELAAEFNYQNLHFEVGDIGNYHKTNPVDMVISLHACDTATDYAIFNAVNFGAERIFCVPCCQHQINSQLQKGDFPILSRYGIVKERISALFTDLIRAGLLEYSGYQTQIIEFVDFDHTPKNLLIRARKINQTPAVKLAALAQVKQLQQQFGLNYKLYELLNL